MYWHMMVGDDNFMVERGMALHKMLRLITMSLGGEGYLTFMGNEFGHPEWIDFPREGNGWSYHYCRRQWSLADDKNLKYPLLNAFEKAAVKEVKGVLSGKDKQLKVDESAKILAYKKGKDLFAFNFHPTESVADCFIPTDEAGAYQVVMSTDDFCYGGFGRVYHQRYETVTENGQTGIRLYLPCRTAVVLRMQNA